MATARSLNRVFLIGNLTRPPVLRKTSNGSVVCTFGVATNTTWKDSEGNIKEQAVFHNVTAWKKLAEICAMILNTGMLVWLEGELRTRTWTDPDTGKTHYRVEIKLIDMKLLDSKSKKGVGMDEAMKLGESSGEEGESTITAPVPKSLETMSDDIPVETGDVEELF